MSGWKLSENLHALREGVVLVTGPASNWLVVHSGSEWCLIDAGYPGDRELVAASAAAAGVTGLPDAVVLTHAHADHVGAARSLARQGVPVWCAVEEQSNATGERMSQIAVETVYAKAAQTQRWETWAKHAVEAGGLEDSRLSARHLHTFSSTPGLALDLPGAPVVVPSPGHTPGHTSFLIGDVLAAGDAIITDHPTSTKGVRPQSLDAAFHDGPAQASASAHVLAGLDAGVLAPGHGPAVSMTVVREYAALPDDTADLQGHHA